MRELVRIMTDAFEQRGMSREDALELAQNGLVLCIDALDTEASRRDLPAVGHHALEHVAFALTSAEDREAWEEAEKAMACGDPGPMYTRLAARAEATKKRWRGSNA